MDHLDKIFNARDSVTEEDLNRYLNNELSEEEKHFIEEAIADSPFVYDAVEGLLQISSDKKRQELVKELNISLQKKLKNKKGNRGIRKISNIWWIVFTVVLILLFAVISIFIIKWFKEKEAFVSAVVFNDISCPVHHQFVNVQNNTAFFY